jgi:hypothetical protein
MKKVFTLFIMAFLFSGFLQAQEKSTLSIKDLNSDITKYIKKNYEGYKPVEAFKHEVVYEMKTQKGDAVEWLLFDKKGKFVRKESASDVSKMPAQIRVTMAPKDVNSDITKYIKKSEYKLAEAYMYDEAYEVKIVKANDNETLLFDKDNKFMMKMVAQKPAEPSKKADSVPAKPVKPEEPKIPDTTKK